jgi:hypothetical protein
MALDGNRLGDAIVTVLTSVYGSPPPMTADEIAQLRTSWRAIAGAIVAEITANADVLPAAHSGESLSSPAGQPSTGADPQGGVVDSTTDGDVTIVGKGSIQ